ncbi:unnamed protein product [Angiostrongylus costaricensis]|uniref:Uncharacterized protein n=1 Tax=Angiostrongylus costaricensis TaxID=334426 RepID=A0A0R3PGJ8_ANGCS|nr:unnamed protein product [Angiostrongylus costaricensis]
MGGSRSSSHVDNVPTVPLGTPRMENTALEKVGNVTKVYEEKQKMVHKGCLPALNDENHGHKQKHKVHQVQRNGGCITVFLSQEE